MPDDFQNITTHQSDLAQYFSSSSGRYSHD
jgi:hypothetical protein